MDLLPNEYPHRRQNALTGEWILVSPHRTKRPWQGRVDKPAADTRPTYDPKCYLCPGNERAGGLYNPDYTSTFVFTNDFAALLPLSVPFPELKHPLFKAHSVEGICRVICFSPRHDLTLPMMSQEEILQVVEVWASQTEELIQKFQWVQLFENKGEIMGCSNPHPHGQIWAGNFLPNEIGKEDQTQSDYYKRNGIPLLVEYACMEKQIGERVVVNNNDWIAVVPYWALWPFEVLLLPLRPVSRMNDLTPLEKTGLADILKQLLVRYDNLFETSFPYSMGWHGAPGGEGEVAHWQLHAHFYPPLLRSASVKKFMVGYEMLAEAQRDITAESAAEQLRGLSEIHYRNL
jgi:UDPglucose--hexose-1-phosphate uridylyltransferase